MWLAREFLSQRDRWILWLPVPVAAGVATYFSLHAEPPAAAGPLAAGILAALILMLRGRPAARLFALIPFLFALGFAAAQIRVAAVERPVLHKKLFGVVIEGRVAAAEAREAGSRVTLELENPPPGAPPRVRVRLKRGSKQPVPEEGERIRLKVVLTPPPPPALPGAYDFQRAAFFKGLGATGYAISETEVVEARKGGFLLENLRRAMRDKVYAAPTGQPENLKALIVSFMTGDSGGITQADWDVARKSGIAHLIAISGSHFVMIVGAAFFFIRALLAAFPNVALRWPVKKIAAATGIAVAVFYVLLIGAPVSAVRAAVMSSLVMLAVIAERNPFTLRVAAFAALAIMLLTPESLVGAGFQMSFAAVVGLIAFFEGTSGFWRDAREDAGVFRRSGLFLGGVLLTSVVASLAVMPFAFYHFLRDSMLAGLVANMIAVPVSSALTFPFAMLAALLMPFGLETPPLWVAEASAGFFMRAAEAVAGWPHMQLAVSAWPVWALAVIALGGYWICAWRGGIRWLGLVPVLAAVILACFTPRADAIVGGRFRLLAAVRDDKGVLWFSPGRHDSFTRTIWTEREGGNLNAQGQWPKEQGTAANGAIACDTLRACLYRNILFIRDDSAATPEDCAKAQFIVTPKAERPRDFTCAARIIDKWDLYRKGTHLFYPLHVVTVGEKRGDRPWVWPKAKRKKGRP